MSSRRTQARRYAVLALYQWQVSGTPPAEIARHFLDDPTWIEALAAGLAGLNDDEPPLKPARYDIGLFQDLLRGVTEHHTAVDEALRPCLDRSLASIDPVERAILRVGAYEILYCPAMPAPVVINEAINLAKLLGAEQGHRYINGVLDRLARSATAAATG